MPARFDRSAPYEVEYEDVVYAGHGPGGVAVLIECRTDDRTRTVAEVRHTLEKYSGSLSASGSVASFSGASLGASIRPSDTCSGA